MTTRPKHCDWTVLFAATITAASCLLGAAHVQASGMKPATSVIQIDEGVGETSLHVTNTDKVPSLLVTSIQALPGDEEDIVLVTPPMARVEPGDSQLVRFILQSDKPLTTQRLRRVIFEGIPPKDPNNKAEISMTLSQNLPVVISPKGLAKDLEPWKHIKWSTADGRLVVNNPSPYVVRLMNVIELLPAAQKVTLPHTYVLPGQTLRIDMPAGANARQVKIEPVNLYGYSAGGFTAPIQ